MNIGIENNLNVCERNCLNGKCRKLEKADKYEQKVSICSQCIDKLYKYDMLQLIEYLQKENTELKANAETTTTTTTPSLNRYDKGKGLELSDKDIENVLRLIENGKTTNQIKELLGYSWRTINNIRNLTFKNPDNNIRVKKIKREMNNK